MFRPWLLMASVVCGFLVVGCGKKETPIAADASSSPATATGSGGGSMEFDSGSGDSAGGSVPPGGSSSSENGSSEGGYSGSPDMGYAGGPGSSDGYEGGENGAGGQPGFAGFNPGGQMGGGNSGPPRRNLPPPKPKKLTAKERATIAFEAGNMTRAYSLYHAFAISGDETQASEIADEMRWAARRPQIGLKVAVGLAMKNPANVPSNSLKPIGTDIQSIFGSSAGGGGAGGDGMGMVMGMGMPGGGLDGMSGGMESNASGAMKGVRAKALSDAAGLLAEKVIDAFRDELSSGAYSVAFKEYPMSSRPGASFLKGYAPNGAQGMGNGGMGNGMGFPGGDGMGNPGGEGMGFPGGEGMGNFGNGDSGGEGGMRPSGMRFFMSPQLSEAGVAGGGETLPMPGMGAPSAPGPGFAGPGRGGAGAMPGMDPLGASGYPGGMPGLDPSGDGNSGFPGQGGQGFEGQGFGGPQGQNQLPPPPNISKEIRPPEGVTPLAACLHYIGADEQGKLIKKAYEEGYDALLVFEVEIAQNRQTRVVNNSARVKAIIPAETQKEAKIVFSTSELVNVTVAKAKTKNQNDGVEDAANRVVKKLVEAIALKDIPDKLTPEAIVTNRIPKLLKEDSLSKLEKLGEINFYYSRGFIDESQRDDFFSKIAGKFASQLMTGSEEEKEEAIEELLGD